MLKLSIFILLCTAVISAQAQQSASISKLPQGEGSAQQYAPLKYNTRAEIFADMNKAGGELYMYDFTDYDDTPAPKGYKPVYLSLFGRHGARYVHDAGIYSRFMESFSQANEKGLLTEAGERLFKEYRDFYEKVKFREGELTFTGQEQWRTIARETYAAYPALFRGDTHAEVVSTVVARVMMSMFSFVDELRLCDKDFDFNMDASLRFLDYLQPNKSSAPSYVPDKPSPPEAMDSLEDFARAHVDAAAIISRFLKDKSSVNPGQESWKFVSEFMDLVQDIQCLDGIENPFTDVFTEDEMFSIWEVRNYSGYLWAGASPLTDNKCSKASSSCVREIIESADADLAVGTTKLRLRFSHDSGILPMLAFMRLNNFGAVIDEPEEVKDYWRSFDVPMAANLQLVFYKSRKSPPILVKPLYNGKAAMLPFAPVESCYYSWDDFKAYYLPLIEEAEAFMREY